MNHYYVYALVDGMQICYVGYTANPGWRRKAWLKFRPAWRMITLGVYPTQGSGFEHERWWIKRLRDKGHPLTNKNKGGIGFSPLPGVHLSLETRAKISAGLKGRHHSPEARAKMSASKKGKLFSPEHKAKLSAYHKGRPLSLEHKAALKGRSPWNKGKSLSSEYRAKLSAAHKGKSTSLKGKSLSLEHRAKLSAARKGKSWSIARRSAYERWRGEENTND